MIAVDETMVPFRGRLKFKQYIPGKTQTEGKGLGCIVVLDLCDRYLNIGRTIITDNFYTSIVLANELLAKDRNLIGTLRSNRVKLSEVTKAKLLPGKIVGRENSNGIVVAKWRDKRDAGIDLSDQLSSYSSPVRKSIRWYHKVATEIILGTSVVNALIIYNTKTPQNKMSITQFREALVDQILGLDQPKGTQEHITPPRSSISLKHKFQETSEKCSRNRKIRKRCTHCYK
ncbi:uncharacterized protein LOC100572765 [Acyrthosiphon pisum]|uniref:PiggyBac transposable element-derived protein domain-containing protein n=1 Tax=Acyrthosiphon pisum TaxID=7029 RepID=A0A8R2F787_ACYPI|nr:uncharacterized protein LOC100572765 [Acyrthosiphon pisum]|eukprot:XP_008181865.1 PREDICTED: uncharacterized protein LOC100572765 [Acyrthosiphon pisum]